MYVEGKLQTRSWDDKNTGAKKYMTEIVINNMIMLDGKKEDHSAPPPEEPPQGRTQRDPVPDAPGKVDDDLPF